MASTPHKGHHCQDARMRMTTVLVWWATLWSDGQVKSEVFMPYYVITRPVLFFDSLALWAPKVTLRFKSSSQTVNRGRTHLCKCQICPRQPKKLRSTVHSYLFPHIRWTHDHTRAAAIKTMNHSCWLRSFRFNCDNSCRDINGYRTPCSFTQPEFLWASVHIWQLHIRKQKYPVCVISHPLSSLKRISILHRWQLTEHALAYQYIVIQGLKLRFLIRNINWSCRMRPAKCRASKEVRETEVRQCYQWTGLIPKKKCAGAYARNITQRADGGGKRGKYSIYTALYSRDHDVVSGRRKMCTAGANESELHPLTASRSDSGLNTGGEGRAEGMTQISTLCCLPDSTNPSSSSLRLICHWTTLTNHFTSSCCYSKKKLHPKGYDTQTFGMAGKLCIILELFLLFPHTI